MTTLAAACRPAVGRERQSRQRDVHAVFQERGVWSSRAGAHLLFQPVDRPAQGRLGQMRAFEARPKCWCSARTVKQRTSRRSRSADRDGDSVITPPYATAIFTETL